MPERLASLEASVSQLQKAINDIKNTLSKIWEKLNTIGDDFPCNANTVSIGVNKAEIDGLKKDTRWLYGILGGIIVGVIVSLIALLS